MSEENIALVRAFDAAYSRRDFDSIAELLHPTIETSSFDGKINRGPEAVVGALRGWFEQWEWYTAKVEESIDLGHDRAVVIFQCRGKGRASGVEVDMQINDVWTFKDGKIARMWGYATRDEALEAAGLRE
jgi:ketosteroid isomerase-like protein